MRYLVTRHALPARRSPAAGMLPACDSAQSVVERVPERQKASTGPSLPSSAASFPIDQLRRKPVAAERNEVIGQPRRFRRNLHHRRGGLVERLPIRAVVDHGRKTGGFDARACHPG